MGGEVRGDRSCERETLLAAGADKDSGHGRGSRPASARIAGRNPALFQSRNHGQTTRHDRGARRAFCRQCDPALHEPHRRPQHRREAAAGFRLRSRQAGRGGNHQGTAPRLSRPRHPRRGKRRDRQGPADLGDRPAGRHPQLPARHPAFLRVDRAAGQGRADPRRGVRSAARRAVHRQQGRRRLPQRPPHARFQAREPRRRDDRHRLPVPPARAPRPRNST